MSTNDDFNSKKIIEEIENLENDPENKKTSKKNKISAFFESLILIIMIGAVIVVVFANFIQEIFGEDDSESEYEYESFDSSEYSTDDYYSDTNESDSSFTSIEEFMNSELGNKLLTESSTKNENENLVNEATVDNAIQNTIVDESFENNLENNIVDEENIQEEEPTEEYDSEAVLKQEFDIQKENLIIKEEGMSVNNELIFSIENKHVDLVNELWVYVVFYQADKIVAIDMQDIDLIVSNNKKYLKVEETPESFDNYEVFLTKYGYGAYEDVILNDDVIHSSYIEDELIEIEIKNNSDKKIDKANLTILYYDSNKKILDIDNASDFNIRKNRKGSATGYGVWDEDAEEYIEYDDYEVLLDFAVYYN